jgi:hypothetical protein
MKLFALILSVAVLAVGLFIAGWRIGYHQRLVSGQYAIPLIDTRLADAASKAVILHLMDLGKYSDARAIIQGQFNSKMLEVALDSGDWDARRLDSARRACAVIEAFRNAYPSNYLGHPELGDTWTVDQVNAYLKRMTQPNHKRIESTGAKRSVDSIRC